MKFLLDQNLSHRLVEALSDLYPGSAHVRDLGLQRADDAAVWQIASTRGLIIVTKDSDFRQRSFLLGAPPKVVWIHRGNCSTAVIEAILRRQHSELDAFARDPVTTFLELS